MGCCLKKTVIAEEQSREDVAQARTEWLTSQPELRPEQLVFIDESGFDVKITRRPGRAPTGRRCLGAIPFGRWGNNTFIAGLRLGGSCAPMLMQGAMNGDWFCHWVETQLAPTLAKGEIVVCDNLSVHKNARH